MAPLGKASALRSVPLYPVAKVRTRSKGEAFGDAKKRKAQPLVCTHHQSPPSVRIRGETTALRAGLRFDAERNDVTNLPPLETPLFELIWPNGQRWTLRLNGQIDGLADDTNVGIINHAMPLVYALSYQVKHDADSQALAKESTALMYQAVQQAQIK